METINGRILPDDSDRPKRDQTSADFPVADDPLATEWGTRSEKGDGREKGEGASLGGAAGSAGRQSGLSEAECTLGSARSNAASLPGETPRSNATPSCASVADDGTRSATADRAGSADRYVELGELGRGGWGVVQRALDRQLQREVAVKRISNPGRIQAREREQFLHEARITSGLQHPGVVPVHELVDDDTGDTYYVMKLLEGDTLRHHIRVAHTRSNERKWLRHELLEAITPLLLRFIDICNAVAYAHRRGIIHRDLKPSNVMAGAFGETIVVDWGLARYIDDKTDETTVQGAVRRDEPSGSCRSSVPMESEGSVVGTPTYMAPEQARGELASMGSHSDIYSLGVILYEIIAGNHPHAGLDIKSVLRRAREGEFTPLSESQPCVPRPLEEIVHTAMSHDAQRRYKDVESLAEDVRRFMTGERVSVHDETLVERSVRWCGRHRAIASTIGISVLLLMIVSVISTIVIRSAHQAERQAKIEARQAHQESLERLVDARDTADTWLVDLSGSLQFHPAMVPLRNELITQALKQYQRLIEQPIAPIADRPMDKVEDETFKTNTLVWLERAKCHLRLGDLHRMRGEVDDSESHFVTADRILSKLGNSVLQLSPVSLHGSEDPDEISADWFRHKPQLQELVRLEQINTIIGKSLATESSPVLADVIRSREQIQRWIPWEPPVQGDHSPSDFVARAISALVRLELVIERTQNDASTSNRRLFSPQRYENAVRWATWLADHRGNPSDLQLYETIATENADRYRRMSDYAASHQAWTNLIDHLRMRLEADGQRSDWMQSLAHAKIRRAEAAVHLGRGDEAAVDYADAIQDLERTWLLADADEFFRTNLATAENNLGRLWVTGNDQQRQEAKRLFARSISTYQQLLSESATPDILRRLAQTHTSMAEAIAEPGDTKDVESIENQQQHLKNARLAYEILRDQGYLTDADRLAWVEVLAALRDIGDKTADDDMIREMIQKIDRGFLTRSQQTKLESLTSPPGRSRGDATGKSPHNRHQRND